MPEFPAVTAGSSPLARGARTHGCCSGEDRRLIPAGAGSTCLVRAIGFSLAAHPRWRGEHSASIPAFMSVSGSSPLARGALEAERRGCWGVRLIPAGAGSTCPGYPHSPSRTAHPRWRGEHLTRNAEPGRVTGSSPLARGAHRGSVPARRARRLIPAGAGSTDARLLRWKRSPAHPRWRGEHTL